VTLHGGAIVLMQRCGTCCLTVPPLAVLAARSLVVICRLEKQQTLGRRGGCERKACMLELSTRLDPARATPQQQQQQE
jgi:hypothetical protein